MARVKNNCDYNNPFAVRLRGLIEEKGVKHREVAENIGVTRQTIGQYADGTTLPTLDKLLKMAEYFNVPLDYIAGTGHTKSNNADIAAACDYLGINEKAATGLKANIDKIKMYEDSGQKLLINIFEKFITVDDDALFEISLNILKFRELLDEEVFYSSSVFKQVLRDKYKYFYFYPEVDNKEKRAYIEFKLSRWMQNYCFEVAKSLPSLFTQEELFMLNNTDNSADILNGVDFKSEILNKKIKEYIDNIIDSLDYNGE